MISLSVQRLTKVYKNKKSTVVAVDDISFDVKRNEITGLLGPNGAGKTTTIKCICGLVIPTKGEIYIDGNAAHKDLKFTHKKVAALLEGNRNIYWRMTTKENLRFFAGLAGYPYSQAKERINNLIKFFQLEEKENTQARFLSKGMQQKLAIACALVKNTPLLLLDEPTLGLDVESTHEIKKLIKEKLGEERTILLSSHNMKVVEEVCERVIIINKGKIIANDKVKNLKKFFKVNSYRFKIEGELGEKLERELKEKFLSTKLSKDETSSILDIDIPDAQKIYDIIELFRSKNLKLIGIENREPDFEEIYLKIVKNEQIHAF